MERGETMSEHDDHEVIFPTAHSLEALKFTAYNNSAYALSEVIDNSFEAGAEDIHVAIICEKGNDKPNIVAILDNGNGMDYAGMRKAIQYGNGSNVGKPLSEIKGLGRFGVGLISATFNQCESLEIWSWQNGVGGDNVAPAIGLDIPSIIKKGGNALPHPEPKILPEFYRKVFADFPEVDGLLTGTLVVWEKFHNLLWGKADTLSRHVAFECGRIYRNFIASGKLRIVLSIWDADLNKIGDSRYVGIVDPMFLHAWHDRDLIQGTRLDYFRDKPMFSPFEGAHGDDSRGEDGNVKPREYTVYGEDGKALGKYWILASHRSPEVLEHTQDADPGNFPFGRMARRLQGVSILRAGREIMLDPKWLRSDNTIDRWISVSINFQPQLDKIFGVVNNKQGANYLTDLSGMRKQEGKYFREIANNDAVFEAATNIHKFLADMRTNINKEREGIRKKNSTSRNQNPESTRTAELVELKNYAQTRSETKKILSDSEFPDNIQKVEEGYKDSSYEGKPAETVRPLFVKEKDLKVDFVSEPNGGSAFFKVTQAPGVMIVKLNEDHPIYNKLSKILHPEDLSEEERLRQGETAVWLIKKLLFCYARAEGEAFDSHKKGEFESVRVEWGRIALSMMEGEEDGSEEGGGEEDS